MATTFKPVGAYDEVEFIPLVDSLRGVSVDTSTPSGNYVGFYENVYDMVASKKDSGKIENLKYDHASNTFTITYIDGTTENIPLADRYLLTATYNKNNYVATFVMNDGTMVKLDLNELREHFYTREEIDQKFDELDSIKWGQF